ncbi:hypothetical protein A1F94_011561 [Pyrenophora tritici-repentis]|nr:hypothetical protein A1F94_011561 [Pyrenophora tritici-repentis]
MAKRRLPQTSARSKRTKVAAATNNVASTPEASPEPASKPASKPRPQRRSPRKTLAAASQANASPPIPTFELQFLESQAEAEIVAPTEGSRAGTVATTEAGEGGQDETNSALVENFDGIDWARLPDFIKPLARSKRPKSWIFQYGYRVVERHATSRIWFVCKYCHVHKTIDAGRGYNLSSHPSQPTKAWPQPYERWPKVSAESSRPAVVAASFDAGLDVQQNTANAFGNFDVEGFRTATVMWLVNRNHPLSELTTPDFRDDEICQPRGRGSVVGSVSKIHVSFDGWTTKGGKRGFFGVVAHFADAAGIIRDLPIDLPELAGAHTVRAFRGYQRLANNNLPAEGRLKVLEPVKPVVTRWNSYYAAFERATKLQAAYNLYAEHHINRVILEDAHAAQRNNKRPDAPNWMRSTGPELLTGR